jgi:hypothetical protein
MVQYLSNKTIRRPPQSHETIPLNKQKIYTISVANVQPDQPKNPARCELKSAALNIFPKSLFYNCLLQ